MKNFTLLIVLCYSSICFSQSFQVPDSNFEQALIDLGIDNTSSTDEIDGVVGLTSQVQNWDVLDISNRNISDLTGIEYFISLEQLFVDNNSLTEVDLSNNLQLQRLFIRNNSLTQLDMSLHSSLERLFCNSNQIEDLVLPESSSLQRLECHFNQLTDLDLSNCDVLEDLKCQHNSLGVLNLNNCVLLEDVDAFNCDLDVVLLQQSVALQDLDLRNNNLNALNLSNNSSLQRLNLQFNDLVYLNVQNGANTLMNSSSRFFVLNNPNLDCVEVDDVDYSTTTWTNVDSQIVFSLDCPSANDDCSQAIPITLAQDTPGTTQNATESSNNPNCQETGITILDVWYQFIAPDSGSVTMTINAPPLVGKLAIYDDCSASSPLDCASGELQINNLNSGQTYYIQVWLELQGSEMLLNQEHNFVINVQDSSTLSAEVLENEINLVQFYPNPAKDHVTVIASSGVENIAIYDTTGKQVLKEEVQNRNTAMIYINHLSQGVYMLRVKTKQSTITKKLLIK